MSSISLSLSCCPQAGLDNASHGLLRCLEGKMEPCRHMPWRGQLEHQNQGIGEGKVGQGIAFWRTGLDWLGLGKETLAVQGLSRCSSMRRGGAVTRRSAGAVLLLSEALQAGPRGPQWGMFYMCCTHSNDAFGSTSQEENLLSTTPCAGLNQV